MTNLKWLTNATVAATVKKTSTKKNKFWFCPGTLLIDIDSQHEAQSPNSQFHENVLCCTSHNQTVCLNSKLATIELLDADTATCTTLPAFDCSSTMKRYRCDVASCDNCIVLRQTPKSDKSSSQLTLLSAESGAKLHSQVEHARTYQCTFNPQGTHLALATSEGIKIFKPTSLYQLACNAVKR